MTSCPRHATKTQSVRNCLCEIQHRYMKGTGLVLTRWVYVLVIMMKIIIRTILGELYHDLKISRKENVFTTFIIFSLLST